MENQNQLTTTTENPQLLIRRSTDVAGACKEIVTKTAIKIQGKKYVPIEGWMTIATAHGCSLSAADVKSIDGGISAIGEVRRLSDGIVLGRAEGFVGDDEKTWANRPLFARRAMAQTRAMSRAARSVFAHVVVLMDSGLSTTPAEEMGHESEERDVTPVQPKSVSGAKELHKINKSVEDKFIEKVLFCYDSDNKEKAKEMLDSARKLMDMVSSGTQINMAAIHSYVSQLFTESYNTGKYKHGVTMLEIFCETIGMKEYAEKYAWWYAYNNGAARGD